MKNLFINPKIQFKNPRVWILKCAPYSQNHYQEFAQESAEFLNFKNYDNKKNLSSFVREWICQESRNPKLFKRKIQVLYLTKTLFSYLRWLFLRIVTAPPPYTMESINTLQVIMEVQNLHQKS